MKKRNKGLSLLEVIVVIGIIAVLVGLIIPAIGVVRSNSKETEVSAEIAQLDTALIAFFQDNGCFPKPNQLLSLSNAYFNFDAKRVAGGNYNDKWGKPYLYLCPGIISAKGYDLFSLGLLESQGNKGSLSNILSKLRSTISDSDNVNGTGEGNPSGLGGKNIWGLPEPTYDIDILGALSLLRSTDVGFNLAVMINVSNIPIYWAELGEGTLAMYWPYTPNNAIYLDLSLWYGPSEAIASVIAHEATHLADQLASGDTDFDSIAEEYDAYYNEAMVWKELTEGKEFPHLDDPEVDDLYWGNIDIQNDNLSMIEKGEEVAKAELRKRYPWAPEEDQWGDSYVVAKRY